MTHHPQKTSPRFQAVPAIPIVVELTSKGECRVRTAAGAFTGTTLRAAIAASIRALAPHTSEAQP